MTLQEFSNGFDLLYNNITSNKAPGLNEYEKSILLTKAQETLVTDFYKGNFNLDTFESTEDVSKYLSNLIEVSILTMENVDSTSDKSINDNSLFFKSPDDMLFITYEYVIMNNHNLINGDDISYKAEVLPTTQDSFNATYKNPFKFIPDKRVLRLLFQNKIEIILPSDTKDKTYSLDSYYIRYIKKPHPIILEDLPSIYGKKITIEGVSEKTDCKLDSSFHKFILEKAVLLAKNLWTNEV